MSGCRKCGRDHFAETDKWDEMGAGTEKVLKILISGAIGWVMFSLLVLSGSIIK